jgi:hypothetical protein
MKRRHHVAGPDYLNIHRWLDGTSTGAHFGLPHISSVAPDKVEFLIPLVLVSNLFGEALTLRFGPWIHDHLEAHLDKIVVIVRAWASEQIHVMKVGVIECAVDSP